MRTTGAIGFEGLRELNVAGALAALATIMTERLRAYEQASHAVVATEAELFRGAVLDALAHEFKTPLATILTAAGGIREAGPLRPITLLSPASFPAFKSAGKHKVLTDKTEIRSTGWFGNTSLITGQFIRADVVEGHAFPGNHVVFDDALSSLRDGDANIPRIKP